MTAFLPGASQAATNGTVYLGETFADASELLNFFKNTMTDANAGWNVVLDDIGSNARLEMSATDNGHDCYINLSVATINSSNLDLTIEGDVNGSGRTTNIDTDPVSLTQRVKTNSGRLYINATSRSLNFLCIEKTLPSIPYYGGFPIREDMTNPGLWGYGKLDWRMSEKFIAEAIAGQGDWRELKEFYYSSTEAATLSSSSQGCYEGTLDPTVNLMGASQSNAATQSAYKPEAGAPGYDGNPRRAPFRINTGQYLQGSYVHVDNEATSKAPYMEIENAVRGMGYLPAGEQAIFLAEECNATFDAKEYVRYTYITGDVGTQGILINEERQATPFS